MQTALMIYQITATLAFLILSLMFSTSTPQGLKLKVLSLAMGILGAVLVLAGVVSK